MTDGGLSRRSLLRGSAVAGVGLVAGAAIGTQIADGSPSADAPIAFNGPHQAGIATPAQDRLVFASYDFLGTSSADLKALMQTWSAAAALLMAGKPVGTVAGNPLAPPADTGEATGLPSARLTITFGFGPTIFTQNGKDRLGLQKLQPAALQPIQALPGDELDPSISGGDLCVQACSDDPQVAFHAVRNLTRMARDSVQLRWTQIGFGRTSKTSSSQTTPRNLMGFKDGTANITAEDSAAMDEHVWVGREGNWMAGGSYLVSRRIAMLIEGWDRAPLSDQEQTIGREKVSGAPLGGKNEHDEVNLDARLPSGVPVIPSLSHVRLAAPSRNGGIRILRRGYSFTDGISADLGQLDAGLFFVAYMRNPKQFEALQNKLGKIDALNEYIKHTSSGVFAVPPGAPRGGFVGQGLFS